MLEITYTVSGKFVEQDGIRKVKTFQMEKTSSISTPRKTKAADWYK